MGRIFISAAHGGFNSGVYDTGSVAGGTTEAQEMILIRDLVVPELRSRGFEVLSVPDDINTTQTIAWINARGRRSDVALEIHADSSSNPNVRGTSVFHIALNEQRRGHAELLLLALLRRVPQLQSRGARPDTDSGLGRLAFCRQVVSPSLQMEIGFLSNPTDRNIIQTRRREIALGIADGLASWSRAIDGQPPPPPPPEEQFPRITINVNGGVYGEQGIIVNGNAYVPIDLADQLGIDLTKPPEVRRITYRNVVYIKAIDLRDHGVAVDWDAATRTIILRSILGICPGAFDRIMSQGNTTELQLTMFLKNNNESGLQKFPDLPKLYREEATIEGVNYDIAFSQMCVETDFLRFGGNVKPEQNNFGGIGAVGGGPGGASFASARIGVRAQIQHLKAYASISPLVQGLVDPRFQFVTRGIAPLVNQLSGRWNGDAAYGDKITAVLKRLYESAKLM